MSSVTNHVGLCVTDIERSRNFYVEVLGFQPWFDLEPPDDPSSRLLGLAEPLGMRCVYLRLGEFVLELLQFGGPGTIDRPQRVMNELGLTHLSFAVDDIGETCRQAEASGGTVLTDTDIGAAIFIRDPDGQLLELLPTAYRDHLPPVSR